MWTIILIKDQFTLGIFIDLSIAFATADYKILISKLQNYGVRGVNLKWFESYLDNHKQFIPYNKNNSSFEKITCSVAQQGSN